MASAPPYAADVIRQRSALLLQRFPKESPYVPDTDALTPWVRTAEGLIASLTCRVMAEEAGPGAEDVPSYLYEVAEHAVTLKTEAIVLQRGTARERRRSWRDGRLRSISAGPWSESYFGPEDAAKAKMLDPDPALAEVLWALATEDCRASWLALWTGKQPPAAASRSFAWERRGGRY